MEYKSVCTVLVGNSEVRRRVLGQGAQSIERAIKLNRFSWLGHVLLILTGRLPRCLEFSSTNGSWRIDEVVQSTMSRKCIGILASVLSW